MRFSTVFASVMVFGYAAAMSVKEAHDSILKINVESADLLDKCSSISSDNAPTKGLEIVEGYKHVIEECLVLVNELTEKHEEDTWEDEEGQVAHDTVDFLKLHINILETIKVKAKMFDLSEIVPCLKSMEHELEGLVTILGVYELVGKHAMDEEWLMFEDSCRSTIEVCLKVGGLVKLGISIAL